MKTWLVLIALVFGPEGRPIGSMHPIMVDAEDCPAMALEAMQAGLIAVCMGAFRHEGL